MRGRDWARAVASFGLGPSALAVWLAARCKAVPQASILNRWGAKAISGNPPSRPEHQVLNSTIR